MKKFLSIAVAVAMMGFANVASADTLQIKGSDTLINMVQRLAEVYMQQNPGKSISVTGGGSGTGIAALINDKCDIANASRNMKDKEIANAHDNGVEPARIVIAVDGLSVVVNQNNPVSNLTLDQIGAIFRGDVTNWSEVGGADAPITLYGRQSNSGTYGFFQKAALQGEYSSSMNRMNGNSQIVEAVKADASGIGYVGVGYVKDDKTLKILNVARKAGGVYANPLNTEQVDSGVYPLSRPLNQYINGTPSAAVRDFIEFELSPEGQKIITDQGFFAVGDAYKSANAKVGF